MGTPSEVGIGGKRYPSITAAAAALGIPRTTLRDQLAKSVDREAVPPVPQVGLPAEGFIVKKNSVGYDAEGNLKSQHIQTVAAPGEKFTPIPGHIIKGESAFLDPDGRILGKWVKTREGALGNGLVEALQDAFAKFVGAAPTSLAPGHSESDLLTVYPLPDLHFGLYAWGKETGTDWDLEIAKATILREITDLVAQSRPSRYAVVLGLGDYFHSNDRTAATPAHHHTLDVDGRWPKVYRVGCEIAAAIIDLVAQKHQEVEAVFIPGNHDPDAAVTLCVALSMFYQSNPRITVSDGAGAHWYRRFGKVLMGATHGHTMKPERMAMMLASDRAKDWGEAKFRYMMFGHIHHETVKAVGPVLCESFSTPIPADGYAAAGGYRSNRSLSAITFHASRGEIGRHKCFIAPEDCVA